MLCFSTPLDEKFTLFGKGDWFLTLLIVQQVITAFFRYHLLRIPDFLQYLSARKAISETDWNEIHINMLPVILEGLVLKVIAVYHHFTKAVSDTTNTQTNGKRHSITVDPLHSLIESRRKNELNSFFKIIFHLRIRFNLILTQKARSKDLHLLTCKRSWFREQFLSITRPGFNAVSLNCIHNKKF